MVKIRIGDKKYKFPSQWKEVDLSKIIDCITPRDYLNKLCNIPTGILEQLTENQLFSLYQMINFIEDEESLEGILLDLSKEVVFSCKYLNSIDGRVAYLLKKTGLKYKSLIKDVSLESYEKFEEAKSKIGQELFKTLYQLCKIYYPDHKKTVHIFSLGADILNQINLFLGHYKEMFNDPPSNDELSAGVEELGVFGTWATVYNLSGRDILKMDDVLAKPAIEVYTALYYSFKERKYMDSLNEIRNRKVSK
jgi:hypothetical protein